MRNATCTGPNGNSELTIKVGRSVTLLIQLFLGMAFIAGSGTVVFSQELPATLTRTQIIEDEPDEKPPGAHVSLLQLLVGSWIAPGLPGEASGQGVLEANGQLSASGDDETLRALTSAREAVRARHRRWEKLVEVQRTLAQHPEQLARGTQDAATELKANGTELIFEGISGGLSNFLNLQAAYAAKNKVVERQYRVAAASVEALSKVLISDHIKTEDPQNWKPSSEVKAGIDKTQAMLKLIVVEQLPAKELREGLSGSMELTKGAAGFLSAYVYGDEKRMAELLPSMQAMLAGSLDMMKALAADSRPEELQGFASSLGKQIPLFAPMAKLMATTALTDFNISVALGNVVWGSYALTNGFDLEAQADEIRDDQQHAAVRLQRLLPRARVEIAWAAQEERRLTTVIASMERSASAQRLVRPSKRFLDDGIQLPAWGSVLPDTLAAVKESPALEYSMTDDELHRLEQEFKQANEQSRLEEKRRLEAQRAAERKAREEARRRARQEARRRVAELWRWARQMAAEREGESRSSHHTDSEGSSRSSGRDWSHAQDVVNSISNIKW